MDFSKRQYDRSYHIDPIVRDLADVDAYKAFMLQLIHDKHFNEHVTFTLKDRTGVRLADIIDLGELREQLEHARSLRFQKNFLTWMGGHTFYGKKGIFSQNYLDYLAAFRLPEFEIRTNKETGELIVEVTGRWCEVSWWETIIMAIVNTMRNRALMSDMSPSELDITYARAKVKLYAKLERLKQLEALNLSDFGTRRRHDFPWQEHCVLTAHELLGSRFKGTSNLLLAFKHGFEPIGTNAHEMPQTYAALAGDDNKLRHSQYDVLHDWEEYYHGNMLVALPDTFGTTQFLKNLPERYWHWRGMRPDSKEPYAAANELIEFWKSKGFDPRKKLVVFSDGLDVRIEGEKANGSDIVDLYRHFDGKVEMAFGFGTNFTNDFRNCVPGRPKHLDPISLVCKVTKVNGRPAVKLSDNANKRTGDPAEIARYVQVFGTEGVANAEVLV